MVRNQRQLRSTGVGRGVVLDRALPLQGGPAYFESMVTETTVMLGGSPSIPEINCNAQRIPYK